MLSRPIVRASFLAASAVAAAALVPSAAGASFDAAHDAQCESAGSFRGIGSSFQRGAQLAWGAAVLRPDPGGPAATGFGYATTADGGCTRFSGGGSEVVSYEPNGSGAARAAFGASTATGVAGARDTRYAFGGTDQPPSPSELSAANEGPTGTVGDNATLHTIPVAQSAVAVDVRLPQGCSVPANPTSRRITRTALTGAFAAKPGYTTWGAVLPTITGAGCADAPVKRVVRLDSSGTTFAFKKALNSFSAADFPTSLGNTAWPNDSGATAVVRGQVNGAGSQLDALNALPGGGIAYADLATSRDRTFDWNGAATDPTFWAYVERVNGSYASPAADESSEAEGVDRGSNCVAVSYTNGGAALPATTGSWSNVDGINTGTAYAICALTYSLAWERASRANIGIPAGQPAITQDQARAVKDYLGFAIKATGGQSQLAEAGYSPLLGTVRAIAQTGVNALNY
jgi:ABC-type phosphate transport system substrate-binding protein